MWMDNFILDMEKTLFIYNGGSSHGVKYLSNL